MTTKSSISNIAFSNPEQPKESWLSNYITDAAADKGKAVCKYCFAELPMNLGDLPFDRVCKKCAYDHAKNGKPGECSSSVSSYEGDCSIGDTSIKNYLINRRPMFKYGLMPTHDMNVLEHVMTLVCSDFSHINEINTCEIGVHAGDTSRGIRDFFKSKGVNHHHIGIDNRRDFKMNTPYPECKFILGNSIEVYNQIADNSIHFLFIDGCHSFEMTVCDFLLYKDKVVPSGYIAFHDTGKHIPAFKDYQGGEKKDPLSYISCRLAVQKLGLYDNKFDGWELVLDEADDTLKPDGKYQYDTGGITVVRRVK